MKLDIAEKLEAGIPDKLGVVILEDTEEIDEGMLKLDVAEKLNEAALVLLDAIKLGFDEKLDAGILVELIGVELVEVNILETEALIALVVILEIKLDLLVITDGETLLAFVVDKLHSKYSEHLQPMVFYTLPYVLKNELIRTIRQICLMNL